PSARPPAAERPVWRQSFAHVPLEQLPLALRELHGSIAVGTDVELHLPAGPDELLTDVMEGAGLPVVGLHPPRGGGRSQQVRARRERTIADTVAPGMRMLLVGLNPSLVAADAGVGFFRAGNRAWPALLRARL